VLRTEYLEINGLRYHLLMGGEGTVLVFLHGFTGSAANWEAHMEAMTAHHRVIAVDLPGHGETDSTPDPARYAIEQTAGDLLALLDALKIERAHLLGYSMGGRLALYFAVHHPQRLITLTLESASPGLAEAAERSARRIQDDALAGRIERDGVSAFVDEWERLPLFATQSRLPEAERARLREGRLRNNAVGLANSLRGMGTGTQPPLWDRLTALHVPTLLVCGALDTKFVTIAQQMGALIPRAQLAVVPDAGHTVHLEQPEVFRALVLGFLQLHTP
jgi:2-succinyl-6-hydroxy-2,4-cyclohexadiene-1-carboxylate synthase